MKAGRWVLVAVGVVLLYFLLSGSQGFVALYESHRKVKHLDAEIVALHATIDSLQREFKSLKDDTLYIEKIAREKLGMARADETVYKFVGDSKKD